MITKSNNDSIVLISIGQFGAQILSEIQKNTENIPSLAIDAECKALENSVKSTIDFRSLIFQE
jgi:hypothetical protein